LTSWMMVFKRVSFPRSRRLITTTTHAHLCINCHSAAGADKRPCTSWFLLLENHNAAYASTVDRLAILPNTICVLGWSVPSGVE
jgi:hypothetical protein